MKIYHNVHIFAPDHPGAAAMAVEGGEILALSSNEQILDSFPAAEAIDLGGRTIWPGLTDAHVHLQHLAESIAMVDCETDTLEECLDRIAAAAQTAPDSAWIRGHGWNHNVWANGYGTVEQLDRVCEGHPAFLTAKSLHAAWVNSEALALAGITKATPNPASGLIQRNADGRPTGILLENDAIQLVKSHIPKSATDEVEAQIKALQPHLWQRGLTGLHDFDGKACWLALKSLHASGDLKLRILKNIPREDAAVFYDAGLTTYAGDDWLHIGGVKLFADGALGPQTGAMLAPYNGTENTGQLLLSEEQLISLGKEALDHGLALTIHAIGDRANRIVLDAYEELRRYETGQSLPHYPHRIEHVQIIDPQDLPRLAELGIVASVQPIHALSDMVMADNYLGQRARFAYAYRSLQENGATLVFGSDAPVESVNPFLGLAAAVTRRRQSGDPGPSGWQPQERVSLQTALISFSQTPAQIAGRDYLGRLAQGCKADFIILENDPFLAPTMEIANLKPSATIINGECVYRQPGFSLDL
ncbi:MAG: amidohydrolase [Chloroflexota bacterium]|nr:amidohydrolase [Chloroflexota bacterium]